MSILKLARTHQSTVWQMDTIPLNLYEVLVFIALELVVVAIELRALVVLLIPTCELQYRQLMLN